MAKLDEHSELSHADGDQTAFPDVERRLSLYLRALWGRNIKLRPVIHS